MEKNVFYGFIGGIFVGRFTNLISSVIITGSFLYFVEPNFYSYNNLNNMKEFVLNSIKNT